MVSARLRKPQCAGMLNRRIKPLTGNPLGLEWIGVIERAYEVGISGELPQADQFAVIMLIGMFSLSQGYAGVGAL